MLTLAGVALNASWARGPFLSEEALERVATARVMTSNLRPGRADTARVVRLAERSEVDGTDHLALVAALVQ